MKSEEMALEAISALDNYNFMGSQISVEVRKRHICKQLVCTDDIFFLISNRPAKRVAAVDEEVAVAP